MNALSLLSGRVRIVSSFFFKLSYSFVLILLFAQTLSGENLLFHIECPSDVQVDCNDELWDLSIYGTALIYGYGDPQPAGEPEWVEYDLNDCGTGTIVRTWVAYDYAGNSSSCSQTLYVGGGGYANIQWPPNYTIHDCTPHTDPGDLPHPYDFPVLNEDNSCAQLMVGFDDLVFEMNPPACIKILREWTVIDWCQYDPNSYHPSGIWKHTQVIKVVPENPPSIECPDDMVATANADCSGGWVDLPPVTGMGDCGAGVSITNNSPYAVSNGADASGLYPLGITTITYTANDGCGNSITCKVQVTVKDMNKPTPVCYYGLSVSLMQMPDGYYMNLQPEWFNKGSYDNCTPDAYLVYDIEPKSVSCADLGDAPVKVYVTDLDGNTSYCNTFVHVQDNMGMCPPTSGRISGEVHDSDGSKLEDVVVNLIQDDGIPTMTDSEGQYMFPDVLFGSSYLIQPEKIGEDLEGISTLDLIMLMQHIMGVSMIEDPYALIAADVDNSGHVSINDLKDIRELILFNIFELQANTSWRFVDANYNFIDPLNPLQEQIPGSYLIEYFSEDMEDLNFIGLKVGDVSGDALNNSRSDEVLKIVLEEGSYHAGEEIYLEFSSTMMDNILGYQFSIKFDESVADFVEIIPSSLPGMSHENFGTNLVAEGHILTSWFDVDPVEEPNQSLFTLKFIARQDILVSDFIQINSDVINAEAYDTSLSQRDVILEIGGNLISSIADHQMEGISISQNNPNPFKTQSVIQLEFESPEVISFRFVDIQGRELMEEEVQYHAGRYIYTVDQSDLGATGIVLCHIASSKGNRTIKMLIVE
jgi:hypothetical protein